MTYQRLLGKGQRLRYLCQDETRLGLKTFKGKVIMAFGVKPIAPVLWKRDNFWLWACGRTNEIAGIFVKNTIASILKDFRSLLMPSHINWEMTSH
ncbi:hypothetical protein [Microcoleus sp. F4-D5]|uniref:hypothetical protein n=1 Tax=Microcoleus sp. F4-D5 TaxID=2818760 RepID=UPI002FCE9395